MTLGVIVTEFVKRNGKDIEGVRYKTFLRHFDKALKDRNESLSDTTLEVEDYFFCYNKFNNKFIDVYVAFKVDDYMHYVHITFNSNRFQGRDIFIFNSLPYPDFLYCYLLNKVLENTEEDDTFLSLTEYRLNLPCDLRRSQPLNNQIFRGLFIRDTKENIKTLKSNLDKKLASPSDHICLNYIDWLKEMIIYRDHNTNNFRIYTTIKEKDYYRNHGSELNKVDFLAIMSSKLITDDDLVNIDKNDKEVYYYFLNERPSVNLIEEIGVDHILKSI